MLVGGRWGRLGVVLDQLGGLCYVVEHRQVQRGFLHHELEWLRGDGTLRLLDTGISSILRKAKVTSSSLGYRFPETEMLAGIRIHHRLLVGVAAVPYESSFFIYPVR